MTNQEKYEDLYAKIVQWGIDRKILVNGKVTGQLKKTLEKTQEGLGAFLDGDIDEEKDAIGDVMVTLIMAYHVLTGLPVHAAEADSLRLNVKPPYNRLFSWTYLRERAFYVLNAIEDGGIDLHNLDDKQKLKDLVKYLSTIIQTHCRDLDYDFVECLELAYNEIKDRKGYLNEDGVFVKEV